MSGLWSRMVASDVKDCRHCRSAIAKDVYGVWAHLYTQSPTCEPMTHAEPA